MKKFMPTMLILLISSTLMAQTVTVVVSQNKCKMNRLEELQQMVENNGKAILNDLVEQGKLYDWGVMTHSWGDEYNWVVFYVAESEAKFLEAWEEFITKSRENDPEFAEKLWEICWEHKDSMYTQTMGYTLDKMAAEAEGN